MAQRLHLDCLPEAARNELFDFYEFLVQKYAPAGAALARRAVGRRKAGALPADSAQPIQALAGIWKDREITFDELRKSAWQRKQ